MFAYPLAAPSTPSWTAMAWWLGNGALAPKPKAPLCPKGLLPMLCGVPTTRASSCWGIKVIAIRLPFPITPAVIFCSAKPLSPSRNRARLQPLCAFLALERRVQRRGLRHAIRPGNGIPFASPNGLFNLSRLAVWWLRIGITIERIQPGHPQQNGRHERMQRTLKIEAPRPAGSNFLQQQAKFDAFVQEFNYERPHEALDMKYPAEIYKPSTRPYRGIGDL